MKVAPPCRMTPTKPFYRLQHFCPTIAADCYASLGICVGPQLDGVRRLQPGKIVRSRLSGIFLYYLDIAPAFMRRPKQHQGEFEAKD
jgi:hypothetical protein